MPAVTLLPPDWLMSAAEVRVTVPEPLLTLPPKAMELPVPVVTALVVVRITFEPDTEPVVNAKLPPVVVMEAAPLFCVVTAPVTFKPPDASFSVNVPLVVNEPKLLIVLARSRIAVVFAAPVSVPAVIRPDGVWLMLPVVEFRLAVPDPAFRLFVMDRPPFALRVTAWLSLVMPTVVPTVPTAKALLSR